MWRTFRIAVFALSLWLSLSGLSWGQASPPPFSSGTTGSSPTGSTSPGTSWLTLDQLLAELENEARSLEYSLLALSKKLIEAQARQAELSSLLEQSERSLRSSTLQLDSARHEAAAASRSRDLWRIGAILGGAGTIAAFVWGLTR